MISFVPRLSLFLFLLPLVFNTKTQDVLETSLETTDYLLLDTSDFPTPVYAIESLPLPDHEMKSASFCSYEQPKFDLKIFEKQWDQTNPAIFEEEDQLLMVDETLHVLLSTGIFQVFNTTFSENGDEIAFNHYNEIQFENMNLIKALNGPFFLKMFYNQEYHKILIVISETVFIVNIDIENKESWLQHVDVDLNNGDPILRAYLIGNYLYLLRKNNILEKYHLISESQLIKVKTLDFENLSFLQDSEDLEIVDFAVDNKYLAFIDQCSKTLYYEKIYGNFDDITPEKIKVQTLSRDPQRVFLSNSKLFVLLDGQPAIEYFLHEYQILENQGLEYTDTYHIDSDFSDIYISENYLFYSYSGYTTMVPHAFAYPEDLNRKLKITLNIPNIREVQPLAISTEALTNERELKSNYFSAAIGKHIGVFKVNFLPGKLTCQTKNMPIGDYFLNFRYYQVRCKILESNCNSSDYFHKDRLIKISVTESLDLETSKVANKSQAHKEGLAI